ncbi:MAG: hypothetical protein IPP40_16590 [bacterium]|nr:hypothetical protein [bacterium]
MNKFILFWLCILPVVARAQAVIEWTQDTRGVSIAVDAQHNVFTVDFEQGPGTDITLVKRDPAGNQLWIASFDQTDNTKWEKSDLGNHGQSR